VMRRYGAGRHVAAALLWKTYTYRTVAPVVLGWALNRRVPLATAASTAVRPGPAGNRLSIALVEPTVALLPGDPLAGQPGTRTVADADALLRVAADALLTRHLGPVLATLSARCKIGERPLWGSLAEAAIHPVVVAGPKVAGGLAEVGAPELGTAAGRLAAAHRILAGLGHGLADLLDLRAAPDGTPYRRRTCCLAFALPQYDYCATCCVRAGFAP
jgi:FhuF 2Fe-2S C-terminal domain